MALFFTFPGCTHLQLHQFREHAARGDHEWVAAQAIVCQNTSDACSRLYLIKGDACLHLAEKGLEPVIHFACAADAFNEGLALTASWENSGDRLRYRERLCASLSHLQALQSGEAAGLTLNRFTEASKALYRLAPESIPAVYYLSRARLRRIEPVLPAINPATRVPVCSRLKRIVTQVLTMMGSAETQRLPDWERFAKDYQRLAFELGSAMQAAGCR